MPQHDNFYPKRFNPLTTNVPHHLETSQLIWLQYDNWFLYDGKHWSLMSWYVTSEKLKDSHLSEDTRTTSEVYSRPYQTKMMKRFCKNS